jgi:hypothetical protein
MRLRPKKKVYKEAMKQKVGSSKRLTRSTKLSQNEKMEEEKDSN